MGDSEFEIQIPGVERKEMSLLCRELRLLSVVLDVAKL
jgi:hypothetical protein